MDNVEGSEWMVVMAMLAHILVCPGNKVEESFNIQATHDLLFLRNLTEFDHREFPGVVPRTFAGPLYLTTISYPFSLIISFMNMPKLWYMLLVRVVLGSTVVLAFLNFARSVKRHFGDDCAFYLRLITVSQFHFLFYASRTLPNTFALAMVLVVFQRYLDKQFLSAIRWATASMALFRFDLLLLYCPMLLPLILLGEVPIFGWNGAIATGLSTLLQTLAPTIAFDSFLWGRLVWPEAEVFWFNVVENRSHEYGVSPFLWYFLSALPRSLLLSLLLVPIGLILDRRLRWPVGIILVYIFIFSILPHKELRFIIYSIPMLNVPAAMVCARAYQSRTQSWIRLLLYFGLTCHILANAVATLVFIFAASHNYPGYEALGTVQWMMRADANKPYSVYVDNTCAQTGVNRFMQMYEKWNYDKTENLPLDQAASFDFICVGTYGRNLTQVVAQFDKTHRPMFAIPVFDGMKWKKMSSFPFYWPDVRLLEKVAMLRNRQHMS